MGGRLKIAPRSSFTPKKPRSAGMWVAKLKKIDGDFEKLLKHEEHKVLREVNVCREIATGMAKDAEFLNVGAKGCLERAKGRELLKFISKKDDLKQAEERIGKLEKSVPRWSDLCRKLMNEIKQNEKTLKSETKQVYLAVKFLATSYESVGALVDYECKTLRQLLEREGKDAAKEETEANTTALGVENLRKALLRARSLMVEIKADPTAKTFKDAFAYAGRDVELALTRVKGMHSAAHAGLPLDNWISALKKTWSHDKCQDQLGDINNADEILAATKRYNALLKTIADQFKVPVKF
jgi:hypothetical protein